MKKLYVTVSDEAYESLCHHVSYLSSKFVGTSKSSVVDACIRSCLTRSGLSPEEYSNIDFQHSLCSFTGHYSNDSLFKDCKK